MNNEEALDLNQPLSFKNYLATNPSIEPRKDKEEYQQYLAEWFENQYQGIGGMESLQNDYIQVLQRLYVFFQNDPEFVELGRIDWSNKTEISLAIPLFARKLKKIALYYISKRKKIKKTKTKNNTIGSKQGLEFNLREYLLENFTRRPDYTSVMTNRTVLENLSDLSEVSDSFGLDIEELWIDPREEILTPEQELVDVVVDNFPTGPGTSTLLNGLERWWDFGDNGEELADRVSGKLLATGNGAVTVVDGNHAGVEQGSAVRFDGSAVLFEDKSTAFNLTQTGKVTIAFWALRESVGPKEQFILTQFNNYQVSQRRSSNDFTPNFADSIGVHTYRSDQQDPEDPSRIGKGFVSMSDWTMVLMEIDDDGTNKQANISDDDNSSVGGTLSDLPTDLTHDFLLGTSYLTSPQQSANQGFVGSVDTLAVWNRILTPAEKLEFYNAGHSLAYTDL